MKTATLNRATACAAAFSALLCASTNASAADATPAATPVSRVLDACRSAIGEEPRTAMQGCLNAELKKADDRMQAAYARVKSELKKIDSSATPEALRTLKHSQESFTSFRDEECKRRGAALLGGSGTGDTDLACQVALTRWRTAQLRQP